MKQIAIIFGFLLAISAAFAAADLQVPTSVTMDDLTVGVGTSENFTITNNGDVVLTGLNFSTDFGGIISPSTIASLGIGNSATLTLILTPTESESGNIAINASGLDRNIPVVITLESMLEIEELEVKVGSHRDEVDNGDTIRDEAFPGDFIEFKFELENKLDDQEIENIEIEITIYDIDEGQNIEIESNEFDIDEDDSEDISLHFTVPHIVDDKNYDIEIEIVGEDEDGNEHRIFWTLELEIEKEKHLVVLDRASLSPSSVSCTRSTSIEVKTVNLGRNDEYVTLIVSNREFDFKEVKDFSLDEGDNDDIERTFNFPIKLPKDIDEGTYEFEVELQRDNIFETSETLELRVRDCPVPEPVVVSKTPMIVEQKDYQVVEEEDSNNTLAILGVSVIVLLAGVIGLWKL